MKDHVKFTLRLPAALHEKLSAKAAEMGEDLSTYCRLKLADLVEQPVVSAYPMSVRRLPDGSVVDDYALARLLGAKTITAASLGLPAKQTQGQCIAELGTKMKGLFDKLRPRLAEVGGFVDGLDVIHDPYSKPGEPAFHVYAEYCPDGPRSGWSCVVWCGLDGVRFYTAAEGCAVRRDDPSVGVSTYENPAIVDEIIAKFTAAV